MAGVLALLPGIAVALPATEAHARPSDSQTAQRSGGAATQAEKPAQTKVPDPDSALPKGWRTSADRAVTIAGDSIGLHVLAADSKDAYQWRTVATLSEPGLTTDLWVGNSCVTGSGQRAVVVYAPRQFTNKPELMERGAFAAVVDLGSGAVTKLPDQVSLAYFDPGCGAGESVVLTQAGDLDFGATRLLTVDTTTGKTIDSTKVDGQLTSAVPTKDGIVGARGSQLTHVDKAGRTSVLATTSGAAYSVHPDAEGGVTFLDHHDDSTQARRFHDGKLETLAHGKLGTFDVKAGRGGQLFLTGKPDSVSPLPGSIRQLSTTADAVISTNGDLAVNQSLTGAVRSLASQPLAPTRTDADTTVDIQAEVPATGKKLSFAVPTDGRAGSAASPALTTTAKPKSAPRAKADTSGSGNDQTTVDLDATCGVARNDPTLQAYQPTPGQVEWAVDMAVRGDLTSNWIRQGGWRNLDGLGTVNPQGMFPLPSLIGGGHIPPQVLLGILAQESNLWQAEGGAIPGQFSSPLIGGFYGHPKYDASNPQAVWQIDWSKVDCGYGIGQQTDGMHSASGLRPGDQVWPADQQQAIALDYTSNIAVAARTLANKWNELHDPNAPMKVNSDNPASIENWFTAAWDYNAGFTPYNPQSPSNPWGLGYLNNPANPLYPPSRLPFLDNNHYADAANPQNWPYEEKVLGWAAWPINTGRSYDDNGNLNNGNTAGYAAAWWDNSTDRTAVKPPLSTFCNSTNNCDPNNPPPCEIQHLGPSCDTPYWFHSSAVWKDCVSNCGHEYMTYRTLRNEPGNGTTGAPDCRAPGSAGAPPSGSLIIDSVSGGVPPFRSDCTRSWTNAGTLSFNFQADSANHYEAKGDLHQIGGGFGAHFWYAHTRNADASVVSGSNDLSKPSYPYGTMAVTGTWKLSSPLNGWTRVFVHLPDSGSQTQQAIYTVHLGDGSTENRIINVSSNSNQWVSLGVFNFAAGADFQGVELTNYTPDGIGEGGEDIAWDATAFQPLPGKPKDIVVQMGDSYSSGEGAEPYLYGTDIGPYANQNTDTSPGRTWNACRRSKNSWIRQTVLPGDSSNIGTLTDANDNTVDYHSTACSGALITNMTDGANWGVMGQHHEIGQLNSGFLDANTTLVALTAGGNDAGFGPVVSACGQLKCPSDTQVKGQIDSIKDKLTVLLDSIHQKAPQAKIVLLGYPELFGGLVAPGCSVMLQDNAQRINSWADYMRDTQAAAVSASQAHQTPVTFYWPGVEFLGYKVCETYSGINDVVKAPTGPSDYSCPGSALPCPSMESYHPNNTGVKQYALALHGALAPAQPSALRHRQQADRVG